VPYSPRLRASGLPRRRGADRNRSRRTPTTSLDGRRQPDCQHRRSRNLPESQRLMSGHRTTAAKALGTLEVAHVIFAGSLPAGHPASVASSRERMPGGRTPKASQPRGRRKCSSQPAQRPSDPLRAANPTTASLHPIQVGSTGRRARCSSRCWRAARASAGHRSRSPVGGGGVLACEQAR
jgi:hypothetical protein